MGRDRSWIVRNTTAECAVELRCSAGGFCSVALQFGFAVGCEDSEDSGFCPLRIMGCASEQKYASQSLYLWALWGFFFTCWGVNGDIFYYSVCKNFIWCWFCWRWLLNMQVRYL